MSSEIVQDPNPVLHKKTLSITGGFGSPFLKKLILRMKETLEAEDGLGLAAPQINEGLSIFVIPGNIAPKVRTPLLPFSLIKPLWPTVFINPEITHYSREKETLEEGCLSIRGLFRPTPRSYKVKIKALDERGRKIVFSATGLLARVFQHETDHLNGILFIERL
jgi:peptide deformylase